MDSIAVKPLICSECSQQNQDGWKLRGGESHLVSSQL